MASKSRPRTTSSSTSTTTTTTSTSSSSSTSRGHNLANTAQMVAAYRAAASEHPQWGRLCRDPHAAALCAPDGPAFMAAFEASGAFPPAAFTLWMALRTAAIDSLLEQAVLRGGMKQILLLGAGLDSRAARLLPQLRSPAALRFFEVDAPGPQALKRARVAALPPGYSEARTTYVPVDFEQGQDFVEQLQGAGFDRRQPAAVVAEGLIYYLTPPAAQQLFVQLGASLAHPASFVVADYFLKSALGSSSRGAQKVAAFGEPMLFGTNHILPLLADTAGFAYVRTTPFDQLALAHTGTHDRNRMFRFQHLVVAARQRPRFACPLDPCLPLAGEEREEEEEEAGMRRGFAAKL